MALIPTSGNKVGIYLDWDNVDPGTTDARLVGLATSCSLSYNNATVETATKSVNAGGTLTTNGGTINSFAGTSSFSLSADGLIDLATADDEDSTTATTEHGFTNLMDLAIAGTKVGVYFQDATSAAGVAGKGYKGTAFIESIEASAGVDDFATYSVTLKGDGALSSF
tara:strand:+ start:1370 stop:1870 length:501 start_codon:yes stop_codon:yes gene_type:complete